MKTVKSILIEKLVNNGYGFSKKQENYFFVEKSCPEDLLDIIIYKKKSNINFCKIKNIIKPSKYRINPICEHYDLCGGCDYLHINYKNQLEQKTSIVEEQIKRIGKINIKVQNIIRSKNSINYRSKMEFVFSKDYKLGLYKKNTNEIINLKKCHICPEEFNEIRNLLLYLIKKLNIPIYNKENKKGFLKHLVLRKSFSTNQISIIFITINEFFPKSNELVTLLSDFYPKANIIHLMNSSDKITLRGSFKTLKNDFILEEKIDDLRFQIPPTSFFQNNIDITKKILYYIRNFIEENITNRDLFLDIYCGVGLFSIYFSYFFNKVYSVDNSNVSIKAGKTNSILNNLNNIDFTFDDSEKYVMKLLKSNLKFNLIIADPPRNGLTKVIINSIIELSIGFFIYVSCDTSTLSRDLNYLCENHFEIIEVQPFDMFPNTQHIETVVILKKK